MSVISVISVTSAILARWLRTRRFSDPTFRPSWATSYWKNIAIRDFYLFRAPASSFFWLFLFSDSSCFFSALLWLFPPMLFHLSILSEVWLLNFLRSNTTPHVLSFGLNCPLSVCQEILHRGTKYDIAVLTDRVDKCNLAATWLPVGQCTQQFRLHVWPCQGLATLLVIFLVRCFERQNRRRREGCFLVFSLPRWRFWWNSPLTRLAVLI